MAVQGIAYALPLYDLTLSPSAYQPTILAFPPPVLYIISSLSFEHASDTLASCYVRPHPTHRISRKSQPLPSHMLYIHIELSIDNITSTLTYASILKLHLPRYMPKVAAFTAPILYINRQLRLDTTTTTLPYTIHKQLLDVFGLAISLLPGLC